MDLNVATRSKKKPGLTQALYAFHGELTTIGEPASSPSTQAAKVTITTSHVFAEGNGFRKIFVNTEKSKLGFKGSGDRYSKSGKMSLMCFIPGDAKEVAAMIKDDPDFIFLVQQNPCQSGSYWQVGTKCDPATINAESMQWTSGVIDGTETMGWEFEVTAVQDTVYYYEGTVTEPA